MGIRLRGVSKKFSLHVNTLLSQLPRFRGCLKLVFDTFLWLISRMCVGNSGNFAWNGEYAEFYRTQLDTSSPKLLMTSSETLDERKSPRGPPLLNAATFCSSRSIFSKTV